jgi:thiosulfate/3-mercaptopyruvate sulfurtransferase
VTDPVISVADLLELESAPALADVRWYLDEPDRGLAEFESAHIPGAIYIDLDSHLSAAQGPGRHPLPTRQVFASTMGSLGFGDTDLIVAYDDRGGAIAARLWWMLRDIGHNQVRVLDGGITAWRTAGQEVTSSPTTRPITTMTIRESETRRTDRTEIASQLGSLNLLDARAPERYRGDEEPVDPVAGHIPTAQSASMTDNLNEDETFLSPQDLRTRFVDLGVGEDPETVVYCGSGVTACHNVLAIVRAGLPEPTLYPGSWSDWGSSGGAVATGSEPGEASHQSPVRKEELKTDDRRPTTGR